MRQKITLFSLLLAMVFTFSFCSSTRRSIPVEEGWQLLAETKVNFVRDVDAIEVLSTERFTAIRFRVEDRDIVLNDLKIHLENGDILQPAMDEVIAADQYSRVIDIAAEGRMVRKVEFRYRTTGNILKGRANILVFGRRYDPYRY
jgi:hypothetical protein